ncbi:MAG: phosphohydrolase [Candidatus Omnitrophota bacterium]|jgi:phage FluMu protein Com
MINKCPGQDNRNIKVETIRCPGCGYLIEIFSDEIRVRCPKCKGLSSRYRVPSCADWCKAARDCIGEEKWKRLKGGK